MITPTWPPRSTTSGASAEPILLTLSNMLKPKLRTWEYGKVADLISGYLSGPDFNDIDIKEEEESTKEGLEGDEEEALTEWR